MTGGKVLLLGSGGLSIGQAGEFDYSGTQAVKALREEGYEVVVVNPNIATVQTNPEPGVTVYLYPVNADWVEKVIAKERPHAIVAGFGGQTALNCLLELDERGILERYAVKNCGTPTSVLRLTEDRDLFAKHMKTIDMPVPPSFACTTLGEAKAAADRIGYPVIVRAAYALGGLGSGFADNENELLDLVRPAFASSPQVLVEKSLRGWKEVEYEVMRDGAGNVITICNMENFDPLGIHTGDSIVVAPSQTLSDEEFQRLRNAAITIVGSLGIVGECNVQYALSPDSEEFYVIEVNARLSRSSALASKATGYPIAAIAAKVVMGKDLLSLKNPVTGLTFAFFEPAMDYLAIKIPRWDLLKFPGISHALGSTMKSVGEIMAIGRSFPETLQKAVRMVTEDASGLSRAQKTWDDDKLRHELANPTDKRLDALMAAFRRGMDLHDIHTLSRINEWFLFHLREIVAMEKEIAAIPAQTAISADDWRRYKGAGFGDEQIATLWLRAREGGEPKTEAVQRLSLEIRRQREHAGIKPVVKKIDTTANEYPSPSNYLYMSYWGLYHDTLPDDGKVLGAVILGSGPYRIGTSVEFDWCAVSSSRRLRHAGWRAVIMNCNPETVSTDYNASDRLFFEELTLERILDVLSFERAVGVIASMGGQLPNRLALPLSQAGVRLLGHSPETIDRAEDRSRFSAILDKLGIDQPRWLAARTREEVSAFIAEVGFPVLVRPSYVLSGSAMNVAYDAETLDQYLSAATEVSPSHPVVISEFIEGAREIELDGVAAKGEILTSVVSEHVENAGVHSGDATMIVPAQKLYVETVRRLRHAAREMARGLELNGPFNMQFLAKEGELKVIECNARAARSFPFVSKTIGLNLADAATDVMIGLQPKLTRLSEDDLPHVGVKAAMFSFTRLKGADPVSGVEMASTGEVGCIGTSFDDALLLALESSGMKAPQVGVLVSSGKEKDKLTFLKSAEIIQRLGLKLYATEGTAAYLEKHGFSATRLAWPDESNDANVLDAIREGKVDFVINIPKSSQRKELTRGAMIRQAAVQFGCPLLTNMEKVTAYVQALERHPQFRQSHVPIALPSYRTT